jgi:hypothetical protein
MSDSTVRIVYPLFLFSAGSLIRSSASLASSETLRNASSTIPAAPQQDRHHSRVRVLAHIQKPDDCFGDCLLRVTLSSEREIPPEVRARLARPGRRHRADLPI